MSNLKTTFANSLASEVSSHNTKLQTFNGLKATNDENNLGGKIIPKNTKFSKVRFTRKSGDATQGLQFREMLIYVGNPEKDRRQFAAAPMWLNSKDDKGLRDSDFTYYPSNTETARSAGKAMDGTWGQDAAGGAQAGSNAQYWQVDLNNFRGSHGEIPLADLEAILLFNDTEEGGPKSIGCAIELLDKNDNVVFTSPLITQNVECYKIHGPQFGNMLNVKLGDNRYKQFISGHPYSANIDKNIGVLAKIHSSKNTIVNHASQRSNFVRNYVIEGGVNYAIGDIVAMNGHHAKGWQDKWYSGSITSLSPLKVTIPNDGEYGATLSELCLITRGSGSARKSISNPSPPSKPQTRSTEILNLKDDFLNELAKFESSKSGIDGQIAGQQSLAVDIPKIKLTGDLKYDKIKLILPASGGPTTEIYKCLVTGCGGTRSSNTGGLASFDRGLKSGSSWEVEAGGSDVHSLRDLELLRIERDDANDSSFSPPTTASKYAEIRKLNNCQIQFLLGSTEVFTTGEINIPSYESSNSVELRGPCFDHMVEGKTNNRKDKYNKYKDGKDGAGVDAKVSLQFQLMFENNEVWRDKHPNANDFQKNYILAHDLPTYAVGDKVGIYWGAWTGRTKYNQFYTGTITEVKGNGQYAVKYTDGSSGNVSDIIIIPISSDSSSSSRIDNSRGKQLELKTKQDKLDAQLKQVNDLIKQLTAVVVRQKTIPREEFQQMNSIINILMVSLHNIQNAK